MALTAKSMPYKHGFGPFAPEIYRAPLSYPFRDAEFGKEMATDGELAARRAISVIEKQVGADNLAAVIIEPIQGEGGFIVPADGFLPALLDWCREQRRGVHRRRGPDRVRAHRRDVRVRARGHRARPDRHRQGHRRRPAAFGGDRPRRDHGRRRTSAASAAPTAATRSPARRRWPPSRRSNPTAWSRGPREIEQLMKDRLHADAGRGRPHRRRPRPRRDDRDRDS